MSKTNNKLFLRSRSNVILMHNISANRSTINVRSRGARSLIEFNLNRLFTPIFISAIDNCRSEKAILRNWSARNGLRVQHARAVIASRVTRSPKRSSSDQASRRISWLPTILARQLPLYRIYIYLEERGAYDLYNDYGSAPTFIRGTFNVSVTATKAENTSPTSRPFLVKSTLNVASVIVRSLRSAQKKVFMVLFPANGAKRRGGREGGGGRARGPS